jgi:uridine phosphorylase
MNKIGSYLKCTSKDFPHFGVLVGDPGRIDLFIPELSNVRVLSEEREFKVVKGFYKDLPIAIASTGIGAAAAAIVVEELRALGVYALVRAGTMLTLQASLGDLILAYGAVRLEGVSRTYIPIEFPAVADEDLFYVFQKVLEEEKVSYKKGIVLSVDSFYTQIFSRQDLSISENLLVENFIKYNVLGVDMETSAIYSIGKALGIRCVSLCVGTVDKNRMTFTENLPTRLEREKELVRLTLKGIYSFAHMKKEGER